MMRTICVLSLVLLLCSCSANKTNKTGGEGNWQTEQDYRNDEKNILNKIEWLTENPLHSDWNDEFTYVMKWAVGAPHIKLIIDFYYIKEIANIKKEHADKLRFMFGYGNLAHLLKNPDSQSTDNEAIKSGFQTLVKTYYNIRKIDSSYNIEAIHQYDELLKDGKMIDYIQNMKNTRK